MLHSGLLARAAGGRDVERAGADAEVEGELRLRVWGEERAMEERRGLMMVRRRRGEAAERSGGRSVWKWKLFLFLNRGDCSKEEEEEEEEETGDSGVYDTQERGAIVALVAAYDIQEREALVSVVVVYDTQEREAIVALVALYGIQEGGAGSVSGRV